MKEMIVHIKTKTFLHILLIAGAVYVFFLFWNLLLILFAALILAALIDPFATWFGSKNIPRGLAVIITYIGLFGVFGLAGWLVIPIVSQDLPLVIENITVQSQLIQEQPQVASVIDWLEQFGINTESVTPVAESRATETLSNLFGAVTDIFKGIVTLILILVIAFYMVTEDEPIKKIVRQFTSEKQTKYIVSLFERIRTKLAAWIRAQIILGIVVGLVTYIGLLILGVKYAATLALIIAILEFIPYLGPIIASIPALVVAFTQGGVILLGLVFVLYVIVQQAENHILIPKIMQAAVGINPIISIVAFLVGVQIGGAIGALIAIPVTVVAGIIVQDLIDRPRKDI